MSVASRIIIHVRPTTVWPTYFPGRKALAMNHPSLAQSVFPHCFPAVVRRKHGVERSPRRIAAASSGDRSAPLHAGLPDARGEQQGRLLPGRAADWHELRGKVCLAVGLLDEVCGDAVPGEQGRQEPEVRGDLDADAYPISPAMNCASPPKLATKGKKTVGLSASPHQPAIQLATMKVAEAKPASPSAAGAAMGRRKMVTLGSRSSTAGFSGLRGGSSFASRLLELLPDAMARSDWSVGDSG